MSTDKIKLSKRQLEIVKKMQDGWVLFTGISETTNNQYFFISKGFDKDYFNATVFKHLLEKEIIYQEYEHPFDYILTSIGESL